MKSLACLKDDLTRLQQSESSLDVSVINVHEKFSIASQTDLSGEVDINSSVLAKHIEIRVLVITFRDKNQHLMMSSHLDGSCGCEAGGAGSTPAPI